MRENVVVNHIVKWLNYKNRYIINHHGGEYSKNGVPDLITIDKNGTFLAIEAKAPKEQLYTNQWRHCIRILLSGGRFIVGHHDLNMEKVDNNELPIIEIGAELGVSEFIMTVHKINVTTEIKLAE